MAFKNEMGSISRKPFTAIQCFVVWNKQNTNATRVVVLGQPANKSNGREYIF